MAGSGHQQTSRLLDRLVFFWLGALLLLAPVVRGGNRQLAQVALLAIGLCVFATLLSDKTFPYISNASQRIARGSPSQPLWWWLLISCVVSSPLWIGAIQLIELDPAIWSQLAGRSAYSAAMAAIDPAAPFAWPLSLQPSATWAAMWSSVPIASAFLAALLLRGRFSEKLFGVLLFAALLQVVVTVVQVAQGKGSLFYFDSTQSGQLIGSFNNRNHLADFFAMVIPIWFYFYVVHQRKYDDEQTQGISMRSGTFRPLWFMYGFSLLVLILSTQSRGGLIAATAALIFCTVLYFKSCKHQGGVRSLVVIAALVATFALGAVLSVGLDRATERFGGEQMTADAEVRNTYALSTLLGASRFWPWGSGMGTFEAVFPRFQDVSSIGYVEYAHNDYSQFLMELGAPAILIAGALLVLVTRQLIQLRKDYKRKSKLSTDNLMRSFAAVGVLAMLIHSWGEFNMHIPALAITAAFLMGTFLRPLETLEHASV